MVACAASAGPAFEGSGVSCGMRAAGGAIEKVTISKDALKVTYETLGNRKPRGICGSGYISLISAMFYSQVIDKAGRIIPIDSPRIRQAESGREFVVAFRKEADSAGDIVISEADIDNLKRSKAAIFSASAALARHVSLDFPKIKKVFIAGGFGTSLEIESAVSIGLLPDLERERFIFIGNSSLAGSRSVLFSHDAMKKVEEIASRITYFELSSSPGYMDEYMAALFFPHTDLDKFPSVGKKLKD
jgi:uncharacterized 2Fe-2S/4Fe-4S cluster protein (DUF4445 family)